MKNSPESQNTPKPSAANVIPERVDKTLSWLKESRGSWKEKTKESKYELKKANCSLKRTRGRCHLLEDELAKIKEEMKKACEEKDAKLKAVEEQLTAALEENEELKKKYLLRKQGSHATTHTVTA